MKKKQKKRNESYLVIGILSLIAFLLVGFISGWNSLSAGALLINGGYQILFYTEKK